MNDDPVFPCELSVSRVLTHQPIEVIEEEPIQSRVPTKFTPCAIGGMPTIAVPGHLIIRECRCIWSPYLFNDWLKVLERSIHDAGIVGGVLIVLYGAHLRVANVYAITHGYFISISLTTPLWILRR